jgi:hypothetical protein
MIRFEMSIALLAGHHKVLEVLDVSGSDEDTFWRYDRA